MMVFSLNTFANVQRRISIFTQQSNYFKQVCVAPDGTFLQDIVLFDPSSSIGDSTFDCNAQATALNEEADNIEREVQSLGGASCDLAIIDPSLIDLLNGGTGIVDELNCPGNGSAAQCTSVVACNLISSMIPFGAQAAQAAFRNHPTLSQCGASGTNCLNNLGAAIGHNLYDTLTGLCWLVTFGYACGGEEEAPSQASRAPASGDPDGDARLRGVAQQGQDDTQVASFREDPLGWMSNMANSFVAMIADSISNRYGCQQWSGLPFVSECVMPMEWDCANCDQKLNMICGVTGYIGTEVLVTFFTAGAAGAVKGLSNSLKGVRAVSQVTDYIAATRVARLAGRAGSAVGRGLGAVWHGIANSRIVQGIQSFSRRISVNARLANRRVARSVRIYGQGQRYMIDAAKRYNELAEAAYNFGYRATGGAKRTASTRMVQEYPLLSDITSGRYTGVRTPQDYLRASIPANRRANYRVTTTTDRPPRVVISDIRSAEFESSLRFDFNPQATAPRPRVEPPPPAARAPAGRTVDVPEVPEPTVITVTGTRNFDRYPELPVSTRSQEDLVRALGGESAYNNELARLAREEYRLPGNFEGAAYDLHDAWKTANPQLRSTRPELFVDFDDLPAAERARYADELGRAFRESNPEILNSAAYQEYRASLNAPDVNPGAGSLIVRSDEGSVVTGGAGLVARTPADDGLRVSVGPRLSGARDATRTTDLTTGQLRTGGAGEEALRRFGGDSMSFQDRELILDILLGGPRKSTYTRNPALSSRYAELERRILNDPDLPRLRADVEELAADRIAVGNRLADEEIADISRNGIRSEVSSIECRSFANVTPGAFPTSGRCRRVKFDQDVNGRYCSCGAMNKTSFTWLVRCPTSEREFRSLSTYVDELALPSGSAPEMCTRVDIPRGKECYIGPTSATFAGMGGAMQMLCEHRSPRDPRARATPERPATAEDIAAYEQQLEDIRSFGLDFGGQSVSPNRWSPFSTFTEFQGIIDRAARSCPRICPPDEMQRILREYDSAKEAIRARGNADDLARLEIEERDFAQYIQELQTGRRAFPGSETRIPSSARSGNRTREMLTPEEMTAAGNMSNPQRIARARDFVDDLTPAQEAAIIRAHNLGTEGIGNYPPRVLAEKSRILEEAGIPLEQRRRLFENGVVGGNRSVDPTLSPSDLRSEGLSLNDQAQNSYRRAGQETDVARRSELLRAYQSDRRLAGQNFEQSAINDGEGAFSQAPGNRTNAAVAYAAAGDVDSLVRVLEAGTLARTGSSNLARAKAAIPSDPANPFYDVLRVEADTWERAITRVNSRRNPAGSAPRAPVASSAPPARNTPARAAPEPPAAPVSASPSITPESIRALSPEEALRRGRLAASERRHDEAALLFRRASNSESLRDPNYRRAFEESLKGEGSIARAHLDRALRSQPDTIQFITELKNFTHIETMLPRAKENLRQILEALRADRIRVPQSRVYQEMISDLLKKLPARPLPTERIASVTARGAPSSAVSVNRTTPMLSPRAQSAAGSLSDTDRVSRARLLVGTTTREQEAAIIRAHNVGAEYGIGRYPARVLQQKVRILEEAGFNAQQRRALMENGIVGANPLRDRAIIILDEAQELAGSDLRASVSRITSPQSGVPYKNLIEGPDGLDSRIARLDAQIANGDTSLIAQREAFSMARADLRFGAFRRSIEAPREPLSIVRPPNPNVSIQQADRYRDSDVFVTETKRGEVTVYREDPLETRQFVYNLPVYERLGLGNPPNGWQRMDGELPKSAFLQRPVGYKRIINGREAHIRVDWDPTKGAHYNIEIPGLDANGREITYKLAVGFRCGGRACTEAETFDMANSLVP